MEVADPNTFNAVNPDLQNGVPQFLRKIRPYGYVLWLICFIANFFITLTMRGNIPPYLVLPNPSWQAARSTIVIVNMVMVMPSLVFFIIALAPKAFITTRSGKPQTLPQRAAARYIVFCMGICFCLFSTAFALLTFTGVINPDTTTTFGVFYAPVFVVIPVSIFFMWLAHNQPGKLLP